MIVRLHRNSYNSIKRIKKLLKGEKMTQIIAALCDNKSSLVIVSDRMVSANDGSLQFEFGDKLRVLTDYAVCLETGTMHEPEILTDTRIEIAGRQNIRQIAEIIAKHYRTKRTQRLETEILSKYGISSFSDFYNKQRLMHDKTHDSIMSDLDLYDFNLDIMLAGMDKNLYPHIYVITEPGTTMSFDEVGFCCKGSGEDHADPVFAFYGYKPTMSHKEVLYIAYAAKKRAEMAGGVGKGTDAWIIDLNGCTKIKQDTLDTIEKCQTVVNLTDLLGDIEIQLEDEPESPSEDI